MHAYSTYKISFYGENEDIKKVLPIIEQKLGYKAVGIPDEIDVEEEHNLVWVERITEDLALTMAKSAPALTFTIDGTVDTSESAGEYMNFSISYTEGKITESTSCWFVELYMTDFEGYEEFCDEFCNEDGNPLYSEEEFEQFCNEDVLCILDSGNGAVVTEVPVDNKREIEI